LQVLQGVLQQGVTGQAGHGIELQHGAAGQQGAIGAQHGFAHGVAHGAAHGVAHGTAGQQGATTGQPQLLD